MFAHHQAFLEAVEQEVRSIERVLYKEEVIPKKEREFNAQEIFALYDLNTEWQTMHSWWLAGK